MIASYLTEFCRLVNKEIIKLFGSDTEYVVTDNFVLGEFGAAYGAHLLRFEPGEIISDYITTSLIPHKVNVFKSGLKIQSFFDLPLTEVIRQLIIHDFSKFVPTELNGYGPYFHPSNEVKDSLRPAFDLAWHHHKHNNRHHPEYWLGVNKKGIVSVFQIPKRYVAEMVADWDGAGKTYGKPLKDWLKDNLHDFVFHNETMELVKHILKRGFMIETEIKNYRIHVSES